MTNRLNDEPRLGDSSPWGAIDYIRELVPGEAWSVTTPGHGGIKLSAGRWALVPAGLRSTIYSKGGWYEEDCDILIPLCLFADIRAAFGVSIESVRGSLASLSYLGTTRKAELAAALDQAERIEARVKLAACVLVRAEKEAGQ